MKTKEEYYQQCLINRQLVMDSEITKCPCPNTLCDWQGKCRECVALHRHYKNHLPICLQALVKEEVKRLAELIESSVTENEKTPLCYRQYVQAKDQEKQGE